MDELIKSKKLQFERSHLYVQIYKNDNGIEFVKITQKLDASDFKNTVFINPNNLDAIIDTLIAYKEIIAENQIIDSSFFIKEEDEKVIIKTFLKGIKIKDLSLQFRYNEDVIRKLLVDNNIEIIEGIEEKKPFYKNKYWKKKK